MALLDVVAFPRRRGVFLAVVLGEDAAGSGRLEIAAEGGARFPLPAEAALARVRIEDLGDGEAATLLADLRANLPDPPAWESLHEAAAGSPPASVAELAALVGVTDPRAVLALAVATPAAAPWFRRAGVLLRWVSHDEARAALDRLAAQRRREEEDGCLLAWWQDRSGAPPGGADGAVAALTGFALRGGLPETDRGRVLAARMDHPEPDQVVEMLVAHGILPAGVNPAPARAGMDGPFPEDVLREASGIVTSGLVATGPEAAGREDLTALYTVAVDDLSTVDVDDALSVRETDGGREVLVHISDAAAVVRPGSALDRESRRRGGTLYLPDGNTPMLPPGLVSGRLSLDEGVVREAVTGAFTVDAAGEVAAARFFRSLVRVDRRLTYEETAGGAGELDPRLVRAAGLLRVARERAGARNVGLAQLKVTLADGRPVLSLRRQDTPGDLVVGEAMVLMNREAALLLAARGVPGLFRLQGPPLRVPPPPDHPLHGPQTLRSFPPTRLAAAPCRHEGLGAAAYLKVTSPIRRYGDMVDQRQLAAVIGGEPPPHTEEEIVVLADEVLVRERALRAATASREDHWLAVAFLDRVGEEVEGVLVRAPRRGNGSVWVPELCRELPLRPVEGCRIPPEGTVARWRIARAAPYRGRVELEPGRDS